MYFLVVMDKFWWMNEWRNEWVNNNCIFVLSDPESSEPSLLAQVYLLF